MVQIKNVNLNGEPVFTGRVFAKILYKTNFSQKKGNQQLLGIDLLKAEIQKDLLSISLQRIEETYLKTLEKDDPKAFMQKKGKLLFLQCIKKSTEDFLTKHYGYKVKINFDILKRLLYTKILLKDTELLFKVPFFVLLNPKSSIFRLTYSPIYNFASESFIEALIDNIVLEVSNCVVYYTIIKFSSVLQLISKMYPY